MSSPDRKFAGNRPIRMPRRPVAVLLGTVAGLALLPATAVAVEWDWQRSAGAQVTFSDNADLDPDGQEEEAAIFRTDIGTNLRGTGRRLTLAADTSLGLLRQTNRDSFDVDHRLRSLGSFELVPDRLGVDGSLFSTRELASSTARETGNTAGSDLDSRVTVTSASISPYWQQRYGRWAQSLVRYRHTEVIAGGDSNNSRNDGIELQLAAGDELQPWRPAVSAEWQNNNEEANAGLTENDLTRYSIAFTNQLGLSRRYALTASVGYDEVDAPSQNRDLSGISWSVGAIGRPGPRTSFEFSVGQRYNDLAINGSADYAVTPRLSLRLSASHSLASGLQQVVTDRNLITVDPDTGELITPSGTPAGFVGGDLDNELALRQDVQLSLVGDYGRNRILLGSLASRRDLDMGEEQTAQLRATFTRQLSPRMFASVGGFYRFTDAELNANQHTTNARLDLSYRLGPHTSVFGGYSYTQRQSADARLEYAEHAVTFGGRVNF